MLVPSKSFKCPNAQASKALQFVQVLMSNPLWGWRLQGKLNLEATTWATGIHWSCTSHPAQICLKCWNLSYFARHVFFYRCWSLRWHIGGFCFAQAKTSGNPAGVVQQRVKRLALQYIGESHMWLAIYIMNHHDRLSTKNWTAFPKARTTKPHQTCGCVCSACTLCRLCAWWHVFSAVVLALVLHQAGPVTAPYGSYRFNVFLGMMHCNSSHAYYKNIYDNMKTYEKHIVKQWIQLPTGVWHPNRAHGRCRWCLASRERVLWGRVAGRW